MVEFEERWWQDGASKAIAIQHEFGVSAAQYYEMLTYLIEDHAVVEHAPTLARRLRRRRDGRVRGRLFLGEPALPSLLGQDD